MDITGILYLLPLLFAGGTTLILIYKVYPKRDSLMIRRFMFLVSFVSLWAFSYALELAMGSYELTMFFKMVKYIAIVNVPIFWTTVALHYAGKEDWVKRRNLILIMIPAYTILLAIWANPLHHLFYPDPTPFWMGPFMTVKTELGPLFWVHTAYAYSLVAVGFTVLLRMIITSRRMFSKQTLILLLAALLPSIGNAIYVIGGYQPFPIDYDLTPLLFMASSLAFWWAIFRYKFLDVVPIARETVFENISDAIFVLDRENRVVDFNDAAEELFNNKIISYSGSDIVGVKAGNVFSERKNILEEYGKRKEGQSEIQLEGADGNEYYYDLRITPIYDNQNRFTGRVIILRDITARKEAEEREEFLHSILRHDLGNKLQVIDGYLELVKEKDIGGQEERFLENALEGTSQGIELIENIRTLNKIDIEEDLRPIDLKSVIDTSLKRHEDLAREKGFEVENEIDQEVKVMAGSLLRELFSNLVENTYTHSEGSLMRVSLREGKNGLKVTIEDDGKGIPDDLKETLTEKGEKGETSTGSGLGMYLVNEIAKSYEGKLKILDSELGGARFDVFLKKA